MGFIQEKDTWMSLFDVILDSSAADLTRPITTRPVTTDPD